MDTAEFEEVALVKAYIGIPFTFEDVIAVLHDRSNVRSSAYASILGKLARQGHIEPVGTVPAVDPVKRGRRITLWQGTDTFCYGEQLPRTA